MRSERLNQSSLGSGVRWTHTPDRAFVDVVPMRTVSLKGDRGAGLVEYALLVTLISIVGLTAVSFVGEQTSDSYEAIGTGFGADSEPEAEMTPDEKWEKAQADYDEAIADAKKKQVDDKAKAKAEYDAAVAANKELPNKERKAANSDAKAKQKDANTAANAGYKAASDAAKAARNAAQADYKASK
jgi:Flp pilus assembly pilin Flp